jgi:hypothetical protein
VLTDASLTFRGWLAGLLPPGETGAVLALQGLMAYLYWRGLRPDRESDRPR